MAPVPDVLHGCRGVASVAVLATLMLAGCGTGSDLSTSSRSTATHSAAASTGTVSIVMKSLAFSPGTVGARVGDRVKWLNEDEAPHNVTYVSGPSFRSSKPQMRIGDRFSIRLTQPGEIRYVCTLHSWMHGTIVVTR